MRGRTTRASACAGVNTAPTSNPASTSGATLLSSPHATTRARRRKVLIAPRLSQPLHECGSVARRGKRQRADRRRGGDSPVRSEPSSADEHAAIRSELDACDARALPFLLFVLALQPRDDGRVGERRRVAERLAFGNVAQQAGA